MSEVRETGLVLLTLAIAAGLGFLGALGTGCGGPRQASQDARSPYAPPPDPDAPRPVDATPLPRQWTAAFLGKAVLTAAEVRIEGPKGLLDHVATRSDPEYHLRVEKTIPAGFLQEITTRPGTGDVEIRAQLDQLVIAATRRLVVLERPGPVDVVVIAAGDAFWKSGETQAEKRGETLRFEGPIGR